MQKSSTVKKLNTLFMLACSLAVFTLVTIGYVAIDSYSCDFKWKIPGSSSSVSCQNGIYRSQTVITEAKERYLINTKSFYVKLLDRIVLIPYKNDIDVEMKDSLAVFDAEKVKTPQRTFGLQPVSSMTLLHDEQNKLMGVAIFSAPNSIFIPAHLITGDF